jgi:hypothetical protein
MSCSAYPLGCRLEHRGIVVWYPAGGKQFLSSTERPDWLLCPPDLVLNGNSAWRQLGLEAGHSPVSSDEVKDLLDYGSTPHSCVLGAWRGITLIEWRGIHLNLWGLTPYRVVGHTSYRVEGHTSYCVKGRIFYCVEEHTSYRVGACLSSCGGT